MPKLCLYTLIGAVCSLKLLLLIIFIVKAKIDCDSDATLLF